MTGHQLVAANARVEGLRTRRVHRHVAEGRRGCVPRGVQVPVRGEAVQIIIMRLGDKEVDDELQAVLTDFEAESNWLTNDERIEKLVVGGLTLLVTVGGVAYFVIRRRRQR